jgi:hypothetical protein
VRLLPLLRAFPVLSRSLAGADFLALPALGDFSIALEPRTGSADGLVIYPQCQAI